MPRKSMTLQAGSVSFMTIAAIIVITSIFSLKGLTGSVGVLKAEEALLNHKGKSFRSATHNRKSARLQKKADFVICNECFWCASRIKEKEAPLECPGCKKSDLEIIPVSFDDTHFFGRK